MAKNKTTKPKVAAVVEAPVEETSAPVEAEVEVDETPKAKKSTKTEVTVTWNGGSRVYSLAVHGSDFEKLAESFATKFKGTVA